MFGLTALLALAGTACDSIIEVQLGDRVEESTLEGPSAAPLLAASVQATFELVDPIPQIDMRASLWIYDSGVEWCCGYDGQSIWELTRARLPWLFLGLIGGVGAAAIMGGFEEMISRHAILFFFTPLIAAMAGNVGVQSSAIIVQGLANDDLKGSVSNRLIKELLLATLNGLVLAIVLLGFTWFWKGNFPTALAISISLIVVIIVAGIIGTFIPLFLHKRGIDPAIATGPFITTSNDIFGILIYFWIARLVLGI